MRRVTLLLVLALMACGKGPEAPSSTPPSAPPSPAPPAAAPANEADAGPDLSTAAAVDAAAPSAPSAPEPPSDDCAPVAAAYEASLRPKLKKCWLDAANKKKDVMIVGEVKYVVQIDGLGKITSTQQTAKDTTLPKDVVACMTKAVKAEKFETSKCTFKTLTVAEKFPR